MTVIFGDSEPDDAYSPAKVDPGQVAHRLHELRVYIDSVAGANPAPWEDLSADERRLALAIGVVIVDFLTTVDPDVPEQAARNLHNVRRHWSRGRLPAWEELPDDERQLAVGLLREIIEWLRREGTLPTEQAA